jgi:DNA mismatch endonuclease (patch repair protein)
MSRVKGENTRPEVQVGALVRGLGRRPRLHEGSLPGRPDMVFLRRRKVIFVHGCFWHGHFCKSGSKRPKSNRVYWDAKLARNRRRDRAVRARLVRDDWSVLVVWECQLRRPERLRTRLARFLEADARG